MSIRVISNGILDTIQDAGRYGFAASGINPGGAMDLVAMNVANLLVANNKHAPVIEMHFPAAAFQITEQCLLAVTGADFDMHINNTSVPLNTPVIVPADSIIEFKRSITGARCYLAVHGGFDIQPWLYSYSTNLKAKAGGFNGCSLKKGDDLAIHHSPFTTHNSLLTTHNSQLSILPWHADVTALYQGSSTIRIVAGNELDQLTECAATIFGGNSFVISSQSDRMGYHLKGIALERNSNEEMISSAVTKGTIQLLPSGQLIILMADHQTTGGYPRVGHVITADLPKLAQVKANTAIHFQMTEHETAEHALIQQQLHLQQLENALNFRNEVLFRSH